ncbi:MULTISPECIES: TetR family transcriptional regulator [unclassified Streptomyces]|uniref:TetR/AcrR family transcriptional regulator n=1 Tax=unclassified Streptomyces TaxID=2593676 RepID=UPI0033B3563F
MSRGTVNWTVLRAPAAGEPEGEGLRERKKRLMRQQLSDAATRMFVERGFDAVRVAEIAEACGVSEKTVFNYFPTKESLILDLPQATAASLEVALSDPAPGFSPVAAALRVLADELASVTSWLAAQDDRAGAAADFRRFGALIHSTPSLRAQQREIRDELVAVTAGLLARRTGAEPGDPEPQITATALLGLWPVQFRSLGRHLDGTRTPGQVRDAVTVDVHRAANLIDAGLRTFGAPDAG